MPITDIRLLKKIKWDVDSPRFAEAQLSLGYEDIDLKLQDINDFAEEEYADKKIVKIRYHHHLYKLKATLNDVIEERLKIIDSQKNNLSLGADRKKTTEKAKDGEPK